MNKNTGNINKKSIIGLSIGLLIIIGIAIIISIGLGIVKIDSQAQLKTLEMRQLSLNGLNKVNSKTLKLNDQTVLVKDLNKANKDLALAKLELKNKNLGKQLKNNDKQLLLTSLDGHKDLLAANLSRDKNLLELSSLQSSVKSDLLVDLLASKTV
jgi:hypothetical protein